MSTPLTCKICAEVFSAERTFHSHFKKHDIKLEEYYLKFYPKKDLLTNEILKFKNKEHYFNHDFESKRNLISWLRKSPTNASVDYLKKILIERKAAKNLVYTPSQVELISLSNCPSLTIFNQFFDYYKTCEELGYKNKFDLISLFKSNKTIYDSSVLTNQENLYKIYIDTREQKPLNIKYKTEIKKLDFGDYSLNDLEKSGNVFVERKSLVDLISSVGKNIDRFKREIEKARDAGAYLVILTESSIQDSLNFNYLPWISKSIKVTPDYIFHNIRSLIQEYPNIQFLFVDGRVRAAETIKTLFAYGSIVRKVDLQYLQDAGVI